MSARIDASSIFDRSRWLPPERLSLSGWAERNFFLSAESSAEAGRFRPYPYQIGIMDAVTDPAVEQISFMKSARVGATKIINSIVGYYMHQDPCPIMVVQPTVDDAEGYSKEEIGPMLRDCPSLASIFGGTGDAKKSSDTILHKIYPGGSISMVGANSGRGFRRVSRKVVLFDEVDAYPASAGSDGDQILLGIRRTEHYWDRKIFAASTPLVAGKSRIEELFLQGDQRRYYVPCPHCGHFDHMVFQQSESGGHWMRWPDKSPEKAHFVCFDCGSEIEESSKREMMENGVWRNNAPFFRHASFHIWAAYSYSPNATWPQLATEFVQANAAGPEKLRTYVNTVRGQTWIEKGEAPDWEKLYYRREKYPIGSVPKGPHFLTCGVDVQKDRLEFEVVGWGLNKESWSIERDTFWGDTAAAEVWKELDDLLAKNYEGGLSIQMMAVDSGYNTQVVYNWCRRYPQKRVIAIKGVSGARAIITHPSKVDVNVRGNSIGYKVWPVGSSIAKSELYGWLRLEKNEEAFPPGYCHAPEYDEEYFKQLTSEHLVTIVNKQGAAKMEWHVLPGRQNHGLDCRIYARAAAALCGLDRQRGNDPSPSSGGPAPRPNTPAQPPSLTNRRASVRGGGSTRRKGWLR